MWTHNDDYWHSHKRICIRHFEKIDKVLVMQEVVTPDIFQHSSSYMCGELYSCQDIPPWDGPNVMWMLLVYCTSG